MKQLDWKRGLIVFLLYFALALLITAPTVFSPTQGFLGGDTSDAYEQVRHVWWFKEALQTGQSPFWQSNLGYPEGFSGVSLQADTLQFFPMWLFAFLMPLPLAYNLGIWLSMALNGLAFYILAKDRTGSHWGAFIAGVIYLAAPIMQGHLFEGHAGLLVQWPAPLFVYGLFHLVESEKFSWRWFLWCVFFFQLVPSGHMLQVIFFLMPVVGLFLIARLWIGDRRGALRVVVMGAISSVILVIFLMPLIEETLKADSYTEAGGFMRYSADLFSAVSPSFMHPLYKHLPDVTHLIGRDEGDKYVPYPALSIGDNLGEGTIYIGIVAGILALIGLRNRNARWWALVAFITWILALGPFLKVFGRPVSLVIDNRLTYITMPVALFQNLPGFSLARTPGRYGFAMSFALAMMAAYGVARLWQRWSPWSQRAFVACGIVTLLVVADFQMFWPMPTRPAYLPQAVYDLQNDSSIRAVYNLPFDHYLLAKDALYYQTAHEKPLIAGHVTRSTPVKLAKLELLQFTLDPALLKASGADVIIFHKIRAKQILRYDILLELLQKNFPPPFYEDNEIAMYRTPETTQPPGFISRLPKDGVFTTETHAAFYAPGPGWYVFDAEVTSYGRNINVMLDDQLLRAIRVNGTERVTVPVPIEREGFYSVGLRLDPACPQIDSDALSCRNAAIRDASLEPLNEPLVYSLIAYEGVTLNASRVNADGSTLNVYLDWNFSKDIRAEDVRFVHILTEDGQNVGQSDVALGKIAAGSHYPELVSINISSLPPGPYSVRAGWYASETLTRFPVLTPNLIGGQDNAPEIGTFTVPGP